MRGERSCERTGTPFLGVGEAGGVHLRALPPTKPDVRRYVEDLKRPYQRDLAAAVEDFALEDDVDLLAEEFEFTLDRLEEDAVRTWVAVDGAAAGSAVDDGAPANDRDGSDANDDGDITDAEGTVADADGTLAGFVTTDVDEAPTVFDRPDRLVVCDIFVRAPYRGEGLADDLMARVAERAREAGCGEVVLDVDVDNERALAFYERHGFEPFRHRLSVAAEDL